MVHLVDTVARCHILGPPDGRRSVTRVTVAGTETWPPKAHAYNSAVMTRRFQLALLLGLLTVLPDTAQTAPIDAKQAPIVIQHDGSEGDVRVNGVQIGRAACRARMEI